MNSCGGMFGTKTAHFALLLLVCGSMEAISDFFTCAPARAINRRLRTHVKSRKMLPCFRNGHFTTANIGRNVRKYIFSMLPKPPHGFRMIGGAA